MRIEYIGHSGVLVETERLNLIFDCIVGQPASEDKEWFYDIGQMPELDKSKGTVFFVSHNHGDHYGPQIWDARDYLDNVYYVLSKDVHFSSGVRARLNITEADMPRISRLKGYTSNDIQLPWGDTIHVETIPSTDVGVAYLILADGHTIYHAGDHNLWLWEEGGEKYMAEMTKNFMGPVEHLATVLSQPPFSLDGAPAQIELACLLLDERIEGHIYDGIDAYLNMLPIKTVLPIHQWQEYFVTDNYKRARADFLAEHGINILKVTGENCRFEI
ncbi:MAG: MBL fold metallo-hydrolase [Eubacterium sp.]|nr:MBL fold metallo-hydrolase [Candidatus Colimonas fimequi]